MKNGRAMVVWNFYKTQISLGEWHEAVEAMNYQGTGMLWPSTVAHCHMALSDGWCSQPLKNKLGTTV